MFVVKAHLILARAVFRGKQRQQAAARGSHHLLTLSDKVTVGLMGLASGSYHGRASVKYCHVLLFLLKRRSVTWVL